MNQLLKLADHGAAQTDRWLFLAAIITLVAFGLAALGYVLRQYRELLADSRADRIKYQNSLRRLITRHSTMSQKLLTSLDQNTEVLRECHKLLAFTWHELREINPLNGAGLPPEPQSSSVAKPATHREVNIWKAKQAAGQEQAPASTGEACPNVNSAITPLFASTVIEKAT